jgi:hypothetical protein
MYLQQKSYNHKRRSTFRPLDASCRQRGYAPRMISVQPGVGFQGSPLLHCKVPFGTGDLYHFRKPRLTLRTSIFLPSILALTNVSKKKC